MRAIAIAAAVVLLSGAPAIADDCERIAQWRQGRVVASVCRAELAERELTAVDLSDAWTPPVLATSDDDGPRYRRTYVALAQERFGDAGGDGKLAVADRYLELFGVMPSLGVLRARLSDAARHRCHAGIDDAPLAAAPGRIVEDSHAQAIARIARADTLRTGLEHDRARRGLADLEALPAIDASYRRTVDQLRKLDAYLATVRTIQAHVLCDGLFSSPPVDAAYTWQTVAAVQRFQRGVMILPSGTLDRATLDAFAQDSRERDFRAALRVLRERVAAATGLIEDGTAGPGEGTVMGRELEPVSTWRVPGHAAMDGAAPDLVSAAADAAARALGWSDADSAQAFLEALARSPSQIVAIALPRAPAYHGPAMALSVEIDPGDARSQRSGAPSRPALILYAHDAERRIPLVRWPTTIGGWQWQDIGGELVQRWKPSPVGPRVWRDLFVGPSWLPPSSTPDRELVRGGDGKYVLAREQFGPSYRAAFGLVAFIHLREDRERGRVVLDDQGIRTHGTGNLNSLATGASHGCHRLLGRDVVRLADFVLAHRVHVRHGDTPTYYHRVVRHGGSFPITIDSLGYRIELVPPIPVEVLVGR